MKEKETLYINFYAGPGAGKSTTAAGLFTLLKLHGVDCELITEYAKDLTWSQRFDILSDQDHVFEEQLSRMERLRGKVDIAITDSPLIFSTIYRPETLSREFCDKVIATINTFDNFNVFINRIKPYNPNGRNQTHEEAVEIDNKVKAALLKYSIPWIEIQGDFVGINDITNLMLKKLGLTKKFDISA